VRILIGDQTQWGRGFAKQAIHFACCYYFFVLGLHRVEALSWNPRFRSAVECLGWKLEGTMRERIFDGDKWNDYYVFGVLASEFKVVPEFFP
jgi:RimJ/RimL family protein N-acetyltransferase